MKHKEIHNLDQLQVLLADTKEINRYAFTNIDFGKVEAKLEGCIFKNCIFLGCNLPATFRYIIEENNLVMPKINVPFNVYRAELYTATDLYGDITNKDFLFENTYDQKVYRNYLKHGKGISADVGIKEALARTLHDNSISDALHDFISNIPEKKIVGIMGGHGLPRTEVGYLNVALIAKTLTEKGYLMVTGGGPGAMEATHLGAWMAGRSLQELEEAVNIIKVAPTFKDKGWLEVTFKVIEKYPQTKYNSLGIPTWLYGHEPSTPFATHIAKYFDNSIREDGILTIAKGGIIYTPGSAGTMQEIFQDGAQNHYKTFGYASPMVFFGVDYWTKQMPAYNLLSSLMESGKYKNLILSISDSIDEVVGEIEKFC